MAPASVLPTSFRRSVPLTAAVAAAAQVTGRPVRIMLDRDEDMVTSGSRHPFLGRSGQASVSCNREPGHGLVNWEQPHHQGCFIFPDKYISTFSLTIGS